MNYQVKPSTHIRGVAIVAPLDFDPSAAKLCEAFSGGRYSPRERGFRMSAESLRHFMCAARLGCKSPDGETVVWQSECGRKTYRFSPAHPQRFLRSIATVAKDASA